MCSMEMWYEPPLLDKYIKRQIVDVRGRCNVGNRSGCHLRADHHLQLGGLE